MTVDRSDAANARRMRWLLAGNGYFMEEESLCGPWQDPGDEQEMDRAREYIDEAIADQHTDVTVLPEPPKCIRDVLDKPGVYLMSLDHLIGCIGFYFEVDSDGNVHQLKPETKERDGILDVASWTPDSADATVTPV